MTTWFTADTHFGHERIIDVGHGRPFRTIEDHDKELIRRWNAVVAASDHIYHLGDFSFHKKGRTLEILNILKGQIHLVAGNHDSKSLYKQLMNLGLMASVDDYKEIRVDEQKIILSHYPFLTWKAAHQGSWMLHGHCHGNLQAERTTRLDVGVDNWVYAPVSFAEVAAEMKRRTYKPVDHHE